MIYFSTKALMVCTMSHWYTVLVYTYTTTTVLIVHTYIHVLATCYLFIFLAPQGQQKHYSVHLS